MMNQFYKTVTDLLEGNPIILLGNGNTYKFVKLCSTRINGLHFPHAFEYQISTNIKKRVTIEFIHYMYQQYVNQGQIWSRAAMFEAFPLEQRSRPCNYTIAKFIVEKLPSK